MSDDRTTELRALERALAKLGDNDLGHRHLGPLASAELESVFEGESWPYAAPSGAIEIDLHGEPDDHLRLVALVADNAGDRVDPDVSRWCREPGRPWRERREAFQLVLDELIRRDVPFRCVDPDALEEDGDGDDATSEAAMWDDGQFRRQRRDVLDDLLERAPRAQRWMFLRPAPRESVSTRLAKLVWNVDFSDELDDELRARSATPGLRRSLRSLPPVWRRIALNTWGSAVAQDEPCSEDMAMLTRAMSDMSEEVARDASVACALRGRQVVNGHYGLLATALAPRPHPCVRRPSIDWLRDAGWLAPMNTVSGYSTLIMHRPVRRFLCGQTDAARRLDVHHYIATCSLEKATLSEQLEIHHHAVAAGDTRRAVDTAVAYVGHLRQLAIQLSLKERFDDSARLYRELVEKDPTDSYAWEYLGYNLARAQGDANDVEDALRRACDLESDNPLYRGRLIGFRAETGQSVADDVNRSISLYLDPNFANGWSAVRYFAEAVLNGIERGARGGPKPERSIAEARTITRKWGSKLVQHERLRRFTEYSWWVG